MSSPSPNSPPRLGGVAAPPRKGARAPLPGATCLSSTRHPDRNPRREDGNRQQPDRNVRHQPALSFGHRQTAVLRILGPDRDKVFILSEPAHGVQEKVSISLRTEEAV